MVNYKLHDARALVSLALDIPESYIKDWSSIETLDKWDSLGHMRIILEIEQSLGCELQSEQILAIETIEDIARILAIAH